MVQSIGISIVAVNQILLWSHINPNDLINTNVSQATQPLGEIAIEVKNKYSDQYETFINYILPALGLLVMYWGLKMAALARAVINGYWNPNIVVFKDKKFQELKTNGIYSKIRHPIYLAEVLLALGTAIAGTSWLLLLFPIILAIINFKRAKNEDKELERIFGNEFLNCKDRVSACGLGTR